MPSMDALLGLGVGVALSTAADLRVFVPLLLTSSAPTSCQTWVETVKGFAAQERTVLEEVTRARASATGIKLTPEMLNDPAALRRFQEAQTQLSGALSRVLVTMERYPELKSNQNFLTLQRQLEGLENRIAVERRRFNETVRDYNTEVRRFPGSLVCVLPRLRREALLRNEPSDDVSTRDSG